MPPTAAADDISVFLSLVLQLMLFLAAGSKMTPAK
jgi:hypothetical protein